MQQTHTYTQTTRNIRITVYPIYLDGQSSPQENQYVWAYHVIIENTGGETVHLKTRHWRITNSYGQTQEINGDGVVGEQPVIEPGEVFEYTSGVPLSTPSGIMVGFYRMETSTGEMLDIPVPAFSLDSPYEVVSLN